MEYGEESVMGVAYRELLPVWGRGHNALDQLQDEGTQHGDLGASGKIKTPSTPLGSWQFGQG